MPAPVALIVQGLSWILAACALVGMVDAFRWPSAAYTFVGKLPKLAWIAILGVGAVAIWWMSPISIFGLSGVVGMGVYFAIIRPKIKDLKGI